MKRLAIKTCKNSGEVILEYFAIIAVIVTTLTLGLPSITQNIPGLLDLDGCKNTVMLGMDGHPQTIMITCAPGSEQLNNLEFSGPS